MLFRSDIDDELRRKVAVVFCDRRELTPRIGPGSGNSLRRRYVLVSITTEDELQHRIFEAQIVRGWLVEQEAVRSVYGLTLIHGQIPFHFWIDILADPYEADRIISELEEQCDHRAIEVGVRSMDVMEYLKMQSVEGIESTDFGQEVRAFLAAIGDVDPDAKGSIDSDYRISEGHTIVIKCGLAWYDQSDSVTQEINSTARDSVTKFYGYLYFGNFAQHDDQADQYLRNASTAWDRIYQILEAKCRDVLYWHFNISTREALKRSIRDYFTGRLDDSGLQQVKANPVRALFDYLKYENIQFAGDIDMKWIRRELSDHIFDFRNDIAHEERALSRLRLRSGAIDAREHDCDSIIAVTRSLIEILNAVEAYLEEAKARAVSA